MSHSPATENQVFERADRCVRDHFWPATTGPRHRLRLSAWAVPGEPIPFSRVPTDAFTEITPGWAWGSPWSTTWFRVEGHIPDDWDPASVDLDIDLGWTWGPSSGEGLILTPAGEPVESLSPGRPRIPWVEPSVDLFVEGAANPAPPFDWRPIDNGAGPMPERGPQLFVSRADAVLVDRAADAATRDILRAIAITKEQTDPARRRRGVRAIDAACDAVDDLTGEPPWPAVRAALAPVLDTPTAPDAATLHAVANAHIDTAWLWPFRETVRKVTRTFANAVALLDENPTMTFASSQVQHLAWMHDTQPGLFERIRRHVLEGRWLVMGGTWVEPDGNMPSGESFARQFLMGQTWLAENLGTMADTFWLPDTFGYSAGLPQIARSAGCSRFVTQKLSWNAVNRFPHSTLWWEGLDGSRLLTHCPPADSYNSIVDPSELARAAQSLAREPLAHGLLLYGFGDGGGGPTRDMLASIDALSDVAGLPRVRHDTVSGFFQATIDDLPEPPVWTGELYLEYHRGTLTSHSTIKSLHRRTEALLREAEVWATGAWLVRGEPYPGDVLDHAWRELLVMQFHDVLPGTSIAWVHDEAVERLTSAVASAEAIISAALAALAGPGGGDIAVSASPHGSQQVPAFGGVAAIAPAPDPPPVRAEGQALVIDNGLIRVTVGPDGVTSLIDLVADRDVVSPGGMIGALRRHPDRPTRWDAWDLEEWHRRSSQVLAADGAPAAATGNGTVCVTTHRTWDHGAVVQRFTVSAQSPELVIDTEVDWGDSDVLLRLDCDLAVAAPTVTAETMYGFVDRPTAANTSWEQAKFETCGHRWLRVAEPGYGVALLTPTTYGYSATRHPGADGPTTHVGLSLLRSPGFPDPRRDHGRHTFRHVIVPGASLADTVAAADRETFPVRLLRGTPFAPIAGVAGGSAALEALKPAQDRSGDVILRLRETQGTRTRAQVRLRVPLARAARADLLEREQSELPIAADGLHLRLRPFEVVTLRLTPS